jgi:hypothetical protein
MLIIGSFRWFGIYPAEHKNTPTTIVETRFGSGGRYSCVTCHASGDVARLDRIYARLRTFGAIDVALVALAIVVMSSNWEHGRPELSVSLDKNLSRVLSDSCSGWNIGSDIPVGRQTNG